MEQVQISLEDIYRRLIALENALKSKRIVLKKSENLAIKEDNEGELTDEFKIELEKRPVLFLILESLQAQKLQLLERLRLIQMVTWLMCTTIHALESKLSRILIKMGIP